MYFFEKCSFVCSLLLPRVVRVSLDKTHHKIKHFYEKEASKINMRRKVPAIVILLSSQHPTSGKMR